MMSFIGEHIWIIGASSGIGEALAKELTIRGAKLALSARRKEALEKLNESLEGKHEVFALDVTEAASMSQTVKAIRTSFGRIDRVIFLAAAYTPMKLDALDIGITRQIVEVNLLGAYHAVDAVLPMFKDQLHGQIALCGSVAGYIGLSKGQPYSATKAGIINLAESLKSECPDFIDVKLINPGFVRTDLTNKNNFDMPMIIAPKQAAKNIADGLLSRRFEIHFPKRLTLWLKLLRLLPYKLALKITRKLNEQTKPSK